MPKAASSKLTTISFLRCPWSPPAAAPRRRPARCPQTLPARRPLRRRGSRAVQTHGTLCDALAAPDAIRDCRFSARRPLDTAPEKTGPTRGERICGSFPADVEPFTPSGGVSRGRMHLSTLSRREGGQGVRFRRHAASTRTRPLRARRSASRKGVRRRFGLHAVVTISCAQRQDQRRAQRVRFDDLLE